MLPSRAMPNWQEQFGRVLIEAMACAVPVVGSDSGEIPNVIGDAGLVFPEDDVEALAQQLQRLSDEPVLARRVGPVRSRTGLDPLHHAERGRTHRGSLREIMRVGINAQLLNTQSTYRSAGVSNYSAHLLRHLGALALRPETDLSLIAFVNAKGFETPGVELIASGLHLQRPEVRIVWEQSAFPGQLKRHNVDLVHGLVNVLPLTTSVARRRHRP